MTTATLANDLDWMTASFSHPVVPMTLEVVDIRANSDVTTDDSFKEAWTLLEGAVGYCGHQFGHCVEEPGRYMLLIWWRQIEDHVLTFRQSTAYARWKHLIDENVERIDGVRHFTLTR